MAIKIKKTVVICTLGVGFIVAIYSILTPPVYKATIQIHVSQANPKSFLVKDDASLRRYISEQYKVLKDEKILNRIINNLHLGISKRFMVKDPAGVLKKAIRIEHVKGTNLINISVYMDSPTLARRIATALAAEYADTVQQNNFALTKKALTWLVETSQLSKKIKEHEENISKFIEKNDLKSLDRDLDRTKEIRDLLLEERDSAMLNLSRLQSKLEYYQEVLQSGDTEQVASAFRLDHIIEEMKMERNRKEIELYNLKYSYQEAHPQITALKKEIEAIDIEIDKRAKKILENKKREVDFITERLETLDEKAALNSEKVRELEGFKRELDSLSRERDIHHKLYNEALNTLKKGEFYVMEIKGINILDEAAISTPVAPNTARDTLLGLLGGFILGNVILIIREKRPRRGRPAEDKELK